MATIIDYLDDTTLYSVVQHIPFENITAFMTTCTTFCGVASMYIDDCIKKAEKFEWEGVPTPILRNFLFEMFDTCIKTKDYDPMLDLGKKCKGYEKDVTTILGEFLTNMWEPGWFENTTIFELFSYLMQSFLDEENTSGVDGVLKAVGYEKDAYGSLEVDLYKWAMTGPSTILLKYICDDYEVVPDSKSLMMRNSLWYNQDVKYDTQQMYYIANILAPRRYYYSMNEASVLSILDLYGMYVSHDIWV